MLLIGNALYLTLTQRASARPTLASNTPAEKGAPLTTGPQAGLFLGAPALAFALASTDGRWHIPGGQRHYAAIRRDLGQGLAIRSIMRKYGVAYRTVKHAQASAWPEPRKKLPPRATRVGRYKPIIDEILRGDLDAPRKQRHTAKRVFARLLDEHDATDLAYGIVRHYVSQRRDEIHREAGRGPQREVFVPRPTGQESRPRWTSGT